MTGRRAAGLWHASSIVLVAGIVTFGAYMVHKLDSIRPQQLNLRVEWGSSRSSGSKKLLIVGDSRAAHWLLRSPPGWSLGIVAKSGASAINLAGPAIHQIQQIRPDVVVIQAGVNDASAARFLGRTGQASALARALEALRHIARETTEVGAVPIVMLVGLPIQPNALESYLYEPARHDWIVRLNNKIVKHSRMDGYIVLDTNRLLIERLPKARVRRDTLHWSEEGYRVLAEAVWKTVGMIDQPPQSKQRT